MKKYLGFLVACVLMVNTAFAQSGFEIGKAVLQAGIGYGLINTYGGMTTPPVSLTLDIAASKDYSVGGYIGYAASKDVTFPKGYLGVVTQDVGTDYTYFIFGGRLCYHFDTKRKNLDAYAGVMVGYNAASATQFGNKLYDFDFNLKLRESALLYGAQLGGRYYFSRTVGVFGEVGYGVGYITGGVSFRL